jgi:hypothetical protein
MNIVFQIFFTSFLVSPGYAKQIASFEELANSDLIHGRDKSLEEAMSRVNYEKLKLKEFVCPKRTVCLTRLFTKGDITTMTVKIDTEYVLSQYMQGLSGSKVFCSVNENVLTINTAMSLRRGHRLFEKFDVVIRRCMEPGLVDKYWSEMNFNLRLKSMSKLRKLDDEVSITAYFVFSLSHLKVDFFVLGFVYVLSVIVCLFEFSCK